MANQQLLLNGYADMSSIATAPGGSTATGELVIIEFEDGGSKTARAAALHRAFEKLAEEGHI